MNGTLWLITNPDSGSNSDEMVAQVSAAFAEAGHAPRRRLSIKDGLPAIAELEREGVGIVAVLAGDGTVNALAAALQGWRGALLVLPGGTANLLAGELHGKRAAAEIARGFSSLGAIRRNCIRSRVGTALVEVLAGPGAFWSEVREEMRSGAALGVAGKAVEAIRQSTSGPMVALVDPPLGDPAGYAGIRLSIAAGGMAVDGYGADTVGEFLQQGLALLRRNFREGPHETLGLHPGALCRSLGDEPIALMIDGERREGSTQERFSLAPFALDLLASP